AFTTDIRRKGNPFFVLESAGLPIGFDCNGRFVIALDAEDFDALEIRAIGSAWFHSPGTEMFSNIGSSESKTFRKGVAPFEFVRREITEPFFQIIGFNGGSVGRFGGNAGGCRNG